MQIALLVILCLTLLGVGIFLGVYLKNEKRNEQSRQANFDNLKAALDELQANVQANIKNELNDIRTDLAGSFDNLRKEVKISQDQSNSKMNQGFERLEEENKNIRKEASAFVSNLNSTFKDYADRVDRLLQKYTSDNFENQKQIGQLKIEIQQELQNVLREIKAPLDLD